MKRLLVAVVVMALLCGAGAWATGRQEGPTVESPGKPDPNQQALKEPLGGLTLPLSAKPIQLTMFLGEHPNYPIKDDLAVMVEMFKRTNIKIHFVTVPQESEREKKNVLLASGDFPDFVAITEADEQGNSKLFLELQDLIPKHAPNIERRMTPAVKAFRETVPGKIYSVPWNEFQIGQLGFDYRLDYLQKMGFASEPKTLEEWTPVLKKAKNTDLNGDGKLDTVPVVNRNGTANMFQQMVGSFGLNMDGNRLTWRLEKDQAVFGPTTDRYKAMVEYCRMLYAEGLLDKEYSTLSTKEWEAKISTGVGFSTWDWFTRVSMFNDLMKEKEPTFRLAGARQPVGPFGEAKVFKGAEMGRGGVAVNAKTKHPVEAVRWMDYQYSPQGKILSFMGLEGQSFSYKNGKPVFLPDYVNMINDYKLGVKFLPLMDSNPEGHAQRLQGNPTTWEAIEKNIDINEVRFPPLAFKVAENARITEILPDIKTFVDSETDKFIMGRKPMSEWDAMLAQLKKMKLDELATLYNAAYSRLLAASK